MDIQKKYQDICTHIPKDGISLEQLKELIILVTGYHREETLVHHIKMMERLGFIIRKDLTWLSKWDYPKKNEIKPIKENMNSPEEEVNEFLDKFKKGSISG